MDVAIVDTSTLGGQPVNYLEIENYLGFDSIEGWELAEKFEHHLDKFNVPKVYDGRNSKHRPCFRH